MRLYNYLMDNGYKVISEKEIMPNNKKVTRYVTTMGSLYVYLCKGNNVFVYGLGEYEKPPTILDSRSSFLKNEVVDYFKDKNFISYKWGSFIDADGNFLSEQDIFERIDYKFSGKEMYNLMTTDKTLKVSFENEDFNFKII